MKHIKRKIAAILSCTIILNSVITLSLAKNNESVNLLIDKGILTGYEDGDMKLQSSVTRAEFVKMIVDAMGYTEKASIKFKDVSETHWAYDYICIATQNGVINGVDDEHFAPDECITYEQAIKIVVSSFDYSSKMYPQGYISTAIENGYLDGVNTIMGENITRLDAIEMIANALRLKKENKEEYDGVNMYSSNASMSAYGSTSIGGSTSDGGGGGAAVIIKEEGHYPTYFNTEEYVTNEENIFKNTITSPLSTFSIDVDTASYSNMRRFLLTNNRLPDKGAIRTEELINYFDYDYPLPTDGTPFSVITEIADCPWNSENSLAMIAVQGDELTKEERKPSNIVFLIDISGSMYSSNKLPLVQSSMNLLLETLDERDTISLVTYASGTRVVLDSVKASEKDTIMKTINSLRAGGGTAGSNGIKLAYDIAQKNRIDGNNRIILCTDGDFNIGPSSTSELEDLIIQKRENGIFLSVLGFGMGNYKDNRMETLADKGNGNYAYIDNLREAKKVLVDEMTKTLYTIAKDVKIQVEFNPAIVKEYRLVGYENRMLNSEDFDNDKKDAGELGAGSTVTVFYEIISSDGVLESDLRYQDSEIKESDELMCVKLRYKEPDGIESKLIEKPVKNTISNDPSDNFRFASSVAQFGMILSDSEYKGTSTYESVIENSRKHISDDKYGFKHEFIQLVDLANYLKDKPTENNYNPIYYNNY